MRTTICYIRGMSKSFNINCRIDDKYKDLVAYLKLQEGGITGYIEKYFEQDLATMTDEDWAVLKSVRRMSQK